MRSIIRFIIKYYNLFLFILLESIALFYTISHSKAKTKQFITSAGFVTGYWNDKVYSVAQYLQLSDLNTQLLAENKDLRNKLASYQNNRQFILRNMPSYSYKTAHVIKNSVKLKNNYITLNKGRLDGVKENMAVINNKGVVGIVAKTSRNYSTIIPVLNTKFQLSGLIKKNGYFGNISWDGNSPKTITLEDIPGYISIEIGDTVVSSQYSSIFPPDIPIGTIKDIHNIKQTNFYKLDLEPTVNFQNLNYVYIIDNKTKQERDSLENQTETFLRVE